MLPVSLLFYAMVGRAKHSAEREWHVTIKRFQGGVCLTAALVLLGGTASAHDIWLTEHKDGAQSVVDIAYGDLDGRELADPDRVVVLQLLSDNAPIDVRGDLPAGELNAHPVRVSKAITTQSGSIVSITYDNGFWLTIPGDSSETNTNKVIAPTGTGTHGTVKYGKLLLGRGAYLRLAGSRLEFVPLSDPYGLAPGAKWPVRLQFEGKPMAGVKIAYSDGLEPIPDAKQPFVTTDANGIADVPLTRAGALLLTADVYVTAMIPALAERDHLYASLSVDTTRR
jgi:nickel transport protein